MNSKITGRIWLITTAAILVVSVICGVFVAVATNRDSGKTVMIHMEDTAAEISEPKVVYQYYNASGDLVDIPIGDDGAPIFIQIYETQEMRAVWVPYMSLQGATRESIDKIVSDCRGFGANAIIFHVRPFGDALYDSIYFPWSHLLTGTQGKAPADDFDPLAYAVRQAHINGMQLHAWVNPLRIQLNGGKTPAVLADSNPYNVWRNDGREDNDDWVIDYSGGKFYNPAIPEVRRLIADGLAEIVSNYNVDGVHFDDYFYPADDETFDDSEAYGRYLDEGGKKNLLDWRTENINELIKSCYNTVKSCNSNCAFGISPAGNIDNCLLMGADVYEWCSKPGYIDYICPQVYWTFDSTAAPFAERCAQWRGMVQTDGVKLYVGLALYKAGTDADKGKWLTGNDIIARQIEYIRENGIDADGFMIYSYEQLDDEQAAQEVANAKQVLEQQ